MAADRLGVLSCFVILLTFGCSSAEAGASGQDDAATDTAPLADVTVDTGHVTIDSAPPDEGPPVCWFIKSGRAEERKCDDCSDVQCKTEREQCFGPAYLGGTFSGVCKSYIECQCGCDEDDEVCQQACKIEASRDCDTCVAKIADCEKAKCGPVCNPTL